VNPRVLRSAAAAIALCAFASCGKKGPPLPPLHIVPDAVTDVAARRAGDDVRIRFVLPTKNANGPNPVNLASVQVLAATIAAGAMAPPNRVLLNSRYVIGTIDVEPPAEEGAAAAAEDPRPSPGEPAVFVEKLTDAVMKPQFTEMPPAPSAPPVPPSVPATAAPAIKVPALPVRIYTIRGVARNGRFGQASARIEIPLGELPEPPSSLGVTFDEKALALTWIPPVAAEGAKPPLFNVYTPAGTQPINPSPLAAATFARPGVEYDKEECFVVRTVEQHGAAQIESVASPAQCVTPVDRFPPAAPRGLVAVGSGGAINLIWEANTDADLGGYLVLRGEAPGDTLQPVTTTPIQETTYRDTTVTPGVRYVYAIVAVDRATPRNVSAQSPRVEEAARLP
jgi:predicted small lipoprotein YifL